MKKPIFKKWWFWVLIVLLIGIIGNMGSETENQPESANGAVTTPENVKDDSQQSEDKKDDEPTEEEWQESYKKIALNEFQSYVELSVRGTLSDERHESAVKVLKKQAEKITGDSKEQFTKLAEAVEQDDMEAGKKVYLALGGEDFEELNQKPAPKKVTIDANGTFAVNDEVQPGLYRAEDGIIYWARTSGFSGELDEILANGNGSGPTIVEIKKSDVGFQSTGIGEWVLIDENYNPEKLTEFSDGTYIVGKDIEPGTYKSDGSVVYWARLSGFSGDLNQILANGVPNGSAIVEIKSSDKGFTTSGGGTWKKIK